jgi:kinetochore protein Nuf2
LEKEKADTRRLQQEITDGKAKTARLQQVTKDLEVIISLQRNVLDEASKYEEAADDLESTENEVDENEEKASELEEKTDESERSLTRLEEKLAHMHKQSKMKMDAVQDNLEIAKEQLLIVERDRREGLARVEAGESEVHSLTTQMKTEQEKTEEEIAAIVTEYKVLEQSFLKRNEQRMTLIDSAM